MYKFRWVFETLTLIFLFQEILISVESSRVRVVKVKKTRHEKRQTPQQGYSNGDDNYDSFPGSLRPEDNPYNAGNRQVEYPLNNGNNHPDNGQSDQSQYDQDSHPNQPFNNNQNQHNARRQSSSGTKGKSYDEEHCNGCGNGIPGDPGTDYPILASLPKTNFDCKKQQWPGYYADVDSRCQVFWICQKNRADAFLCPNGTLFNQQVFVCDWWFNVDCSSVTEYYSRNQYIYGGPGIDLFGNQIQIKTNQNSGLITPNRNVINNSENINRSRPPTNRPPFQAERIEHAVTTVIPFNSNQRQNNFQTTIPILPTTQESNIKTTSQGGYNRRATEHFSRKNSNNNAYVPTNKQIGTNNSNSSLYNGNPGTYSTSTNQKPKNSYPRVVIAQNETPPPIVEYLSRNSNQGYSTQNVRNQGDYDRTTSSTRNTGGYVNNQRDSKNENFGTNLQPHSDPHTDRKNEKFQKNPTRAIQNVPSAQELQKLLQVGLNPASTRSVTDGGNSYANYIEAQKRLHLRENYKPNPSNRSYNHNPLLTQSESTTTRSTSTYPTLQPNSRHLEHNFNDPQIRHQKSSDYSIKNSQYYTPSQSHTYHPYTTTNNGGYSNSGSSSHSGYSNTGSYSTTTKRNALENSNGKIEREESLDTFDDGLQFGFAKTIIPTAAVPPVKVTSFHVKDNRGSGLEIHGTIAPKLPTHEVTTLRPPTRNSLKSPRNASLGPLETSHHPLQYLHIPPPQNPPAPQSPAHPTFGKKIKSGRKRNSSHWTTFNSKN